MGIKLLRCKKSRGWLPDEYLTSIVGFCDRGRFAITKEFTLPCTLMNNGVLFIEGFENEELGEGDFRLSMVRCANCGGEVELIEADPEEILDKIRRREVDMKRQSSERRAEERAEHESEQERALEQEQEPRS
ncbi:MAG: hypothetical protein AB7K09_23190 [Planctomycetota bacterium]